MCDALPDDGRMPDTDLITTGEAAQILAMSQSTVIRMGDDGRLPIAARVGNRGDRLYTRADVIDALRHLLHEPCPVCDDTRVSPDEPDEPCPCCDVDPVTPDHEPWDGPGPVDPLGNTIR